MIRCWWRPITEPDVQLPLPPPGKRRWQRERHAVEKVVVTRTFVALHYHKEETENKEKLNKESNERKKE